MARKPIPTEVIVDLYYKLKDDVYHNLRFYYDQEYNFNPRCFINI